VIKQSIMWRIYKFYLFLFLLVIAIIENF